MQSTQRSLGKTARRLAGVAAVALAASAAAQQAKAATLTLHYTVVQTAASGDPNFTSPTNVTIPGNSQITITVTPGEYVHFGIKAVVTNNPNPASGDAWDNDNGNNEPANLGLNTLGFTVSTDGGSTTLLSPVLQTLGPNYGNRTNGTTANVTATGSSFAANSGSVDPGDVQGGAVGLLNALGGGYTSLVDGTGAISSFTTSSNVFTGLAFQVSATAPAGTDHLTSLVKTTSFGFITNNYLGDPGGNPTQGTTYDNRPYNPTAGDSYTDLPSITIVVAGAVPEPASLGLIGSAAVLLLARRRKTC